MEDLRIALVQADLHWELPEANRSMLEEMLWELRSPVDIVVLPEMFTTGFTMSPHAVAEPMGLTTFRWMRQQAKQLQAAVVGSYVVEENGHYYNRLVWMPPDGDARTYDKRHLFRMAGEHEVYSGGQSRLVVEWKGWRICPLVCYDLRFPVWSRNQYSAGMLDYDLLLYVANWPQARVSAWDTLLQARAIENLCYTAGVNRVGEDGLGVAYNGHSAAVDPKGLYLQAPMETASIAHLKLSAADLLQFRQKFPAHLDADRFEIG